MEYSEKAVYFDETAKADWSLSDYGPKEMAKLDRLFEITGPLKGCRILEPGCGTGRLTQILSWLVGEEGSVVALDISAIMVDEARRRNTAMRNVEIHLCALEDFPLAQKSYDLILCHQVFPHFIDKKKAIMIFSMALKDDGRLIVNHFINLEKINDRHRKAGTAVERDMMPEHGVMRRLFRDTGLDIDFLLDDRLGYILSASRRC